MKDIEIIKYEDKYAENFRDLSLEWLEKYVSVEPEDLRIINNPRGVVIDTGGEIFFALFKGEVAGTIALISLDDTTYEIAKLAVGEKFWGHRLGTYLMEEAINFAREKGAEKLLLYTARKLEHAIGIYEKFGFRQVDLGQNKYIESDMKMEKLL